MAKSKTKRVCLFCMRAHKRTPALCQAKGDIVRAYSKKLKFWQVMLGIERGIIPLEAEAQRLVAARKKAA